MKICFASNKIITCVAVLAMFISTAFLPAPPLIKTNNLPFSRDSINYFFAESPYYIVIDKSDYELKVYDKLGWYATYPIVFGSQDLSDKMKAGDKRTPTGDFTIIIKKIHKQWGPELLLNYPNEESIQKFNQRMSAGLIPRNSKIGDGIAIHATRPGEEWTVDNFYNWTDGCVSVKYTEMKDLYSYIGVGTKVRIQP